MDAFELSDTSPNVKYLRAFFLAVFILTFVLRRHFLLGP